MGKGEAENDCVPHEDSLRIVRWNVGAEHRRCAEAVGVSMTLAWIVEHFEKVLV
ncbi:MAG: hypothetical protein HOO98_00990 [Nitrospira sp.]|nr:hypothetical protein [Nitrospira sp.]